MAEWYVVQQGDCLSSLAKQYGLANWRQIYDAPENADFRRTRPDPNVIQPGDNVFIPDIVVANNGAATDLLHKYQLNRDRTKLRIVVADEDGKPYAQHRYELRVNKSVLKGVTNGQGLVETEIDATAEAGELKVWWEDGPTRHCRWTLQIGHLDPVEHLSGVQARLNNLAFESGPVDGIMGPLTRGAVKRFQVKHGLVVDGIPGPITKGKLKELHGC